MTPKPMPVIPGRQTRPMPMPGGGPVPSGAPQQAPGSGVNPVQQALMKQQQAKLQQGQFAAQSSGGAQATQGGSRAPMPPSVMPKPGASPTGQQAPNPAQAQGNLAVMQSLKRAFSNRQQQGY